MIATYLNFYLKNKDARYIFFKGGARSGKTFFICELLYILAIQKKLKIFIIAPDYPRLLDLRQTFTDATGVNVRGGVGYYSCNIFQSTILFRAFDNWVKAKGKEADYMFFNECNDIDYLIVKRLLAGLKIQAFFDYNPTSFFWKHEHPTFFKCPELTTTYKDNVFLPIELKNEYEKDNEAANLPGATPLQKWWAAAMCRGEFFELSGRCFQNVEAIDDAAFDAVDAPEIYASDWAAVDANADPDVICTFKFSNGNIFCREIYYSNEGNDYDVADAIISYRNSKKVNTSDSNFFVYETATAGKARMQAVYNITGIRFKFFPASKGKGSVMLGIRNLQKYNIKITNSSYHFLEESEKYRFEIVNGISRPVDKYNHCFDALRYAFSFCLKNKSLFDV